MVWVNTFYVGQQAANGAAWEKQTKENKMTEITTTPNLTDYTDYLAANTDYVIDLGDGIIWDDNVGTGIFSTLTSSSMVLSGSYKTILEGGHKGTVKVDLEVTGSWSGTIKVTVDDNGVTTTPINGDCNFSVSDSTLSIKCDINGITEIITMVNDKSRGDNGILIEAAGYKIWIGQK